MAQTRIRSGESLTVRLFEPPVSRTLSWKDLCWWPDLREDVLSGALRDQLYAAHFVAYLGGRPVASMCYYAPSDTRDIGVVEFVRTDERQRGKGIASALLHELVDHFDGHGGSALYLCTANPIAGRLYERFGFRLHMGDGMRRLSPGAEGFDDWYFRRNGHATVRAAHWGDLPRVSALHNHPEPSWLIKDYQARCFSDTRYERHFVQHMRTCESAGGVFAVLETAPHRVVGSAVALRRSSYYEQHVAELDFRVVPASMEQTGELIGAVIEQAADQGISIMEARAADSDCEKLKLLSENGFAEQARLTGGLRLNSGDRDVLLMVRSIHGRPELRRAKSAYYGQRKEWQEISSTEEDKERTT